MKIIYCHHAQRVKNHPATQDDGLTDLGVIDANNYAGIFYRAQQSQHIKIRAIYSSPYFRCMETAKLINQKLGLPIVAEPRLNEFDSQKESWVDLQKRVIAAIEDVIKLYDNEDSIIFVTSGMNVSAFIAWNFHLEPSDQIPRIGVTSCSPLIFDYEKIL